jgi:hypothetical protein
MTAGMQAGDRDAQELSVPSFMDHPFFITVNLKRKYHIQ